MVGVVCIVGRRGKTSLIEALIAEFNQRKLKVATIKHHIHPDFEIDRPGKDSWRHQEAGAWATVISSPGKLALVQRTEKETELAQILELLPPVDVVLAEGYASSQEARVVITEKPGDLEIFGRGKQVLAVAPLGRWNVPGIADSILAYLNP